MPAQTRTYLKLSHTTDTYCNASKGRNQPHKQDSKREGSYKHLRKGENGCNFVQRSLISLRRPPSEPRHGPEHRRRQPQERGAFFICWPFYLALIATGPSALMAAAGHPVEVINFRRRQSSILPSQAQQQESSPEFTGALNCSSDFTRT